MWDGFFSPFNENIELITKQGLRVVPIMPGDKMPGYWSNKYGCFTGLSGWQKLIKNPTPKKIDGVPYGYSWWQATDGQNIGVLTGYKVVALDYDNHEDFHKKIQEKIPPSKVGKVGRIGATYFYKIPEGKEYKSQKWTHPEDKKVVVELLSTGKQTVIPPSQHPCGERYKWITNHTLVNVDLNELEELPDDYDAIISEAIYGKEGNKPAQAQKITKVENSRSELEDVKATLDAIPADVGRDDWIKVGMALHDWSGGNAFDLFHNWSKGGQKYKSEQDCRSAWDSFSGGGRTISSLFGLAKEHGFIISNQVLADFELPEHFFNQPVKTEKKDKNKFVKLTLPAEIIDNTPGTVGKIKDWILKTAHFPQPELSLAAALSVVGVAKGHRAECPSGLKSNVYLLGLAPSCSGKNHPIQCIRLLLQEAKLDECIGGNPASDTALVDMLARYPRRLIVLDEFGKLFQGITSKKANNFQSQIIRILMDVFSSSDMKVPGKEYANKDGKPVERKDMFKPCLSMLGFTTKQVLLDSLNEDMIADGFLSRLLIVEPAKFFPKRNPFPERLEVPQEILEELKYINENTGIRNGIHNDAVKAKVVTFSDEAQELLVKLQRKYDEEKTKLFEEQDGLQSFPGRACEHIAKIALIVAGNTEVTYQDMYWSYQFVESCIANILTNVKSIANTKFNKNLEKAEKKLLKFKNGLFLSEFKDKIRHMCNSKRELDDLIKALEETGKAYLGREKGKVKKNLDYVVHRKYLEEYFESKNQQ